MKARYSQYSDTQHVVKLQILLMPSCPFLAQDLTTHKVYFLCFKSMFLNFFHAMQKWNFKTWNL